jgi:hypothetical protein
MRALILALVFVGSGNCVQAATDQESGNRLLEMCSISVKILDNTVQPTDDLTDASSCVSYVHGFTDAMHIAVAAARASVPSGNLAPNVTRVLACIPAEVTGGQLVRIVTKFLTDNPERLHENRGILAMLALNRAFPCK